MLLNNYYRYLSNYTNGKEYRRHWLMLNKHHQDIEELLLQVHQKGVEQAIDLSIRTGVPLSDSNLIK
jgi:hypothetical protein